MKVMLLTRERLAVLLRKLTDETEELAKTVFDFKRNYPILVIRSKREVIYHHLVYDNQ